MERKKCKKLYRLTPLNNEIKRIEASIYKGGEFLTYKFHAINEDSYLLGLKIAHKLVSLKDVELPQED